MIRVGRIKNTTDSLNFPGFVPIVVMMSSSKYYSLSPYSLSINNQNLENIWQFSKLYPSIPYSKQIYSRWNPITIWEHPAENHITYNENGTISLTNEYFWWREKGMNNKYSLRYPVNYNHRNKCIGSLKNANDLQLLNYIDSRKQIYLPNYLQAVSEEKQFLELKELLKKEVNLLILEVDGPHEEHLDYYVDKYKVKNDFIVNNTMLATEENLNIMLNDDKHPFGHGYCLATALLVLK